VLHMRIRSNGLDKQNTYPCSKGDVRSAFKEGLLDDAWFGLQPYWICSTRDHPQPVIRGRVIAQLSAHLLGECTLYLYQLPKWAFSEQIRRKLVDLMKGQMSDWARTMRVRPETAIYGTDELLVELDAGELRLHETRFR
jgi:hypothetical protein